MPRDLETICLKCLQKEAKKRYATAAQLQADLRDPLRVRPVGRAEALRPRSVEAQYVRWIVVRVVWALAIVALLGLLVWAANRHPATQYQNRSVGVGP